MHLEDIHDEIYYIEDTKGTLYVHCKENSYCLDMSLIDAKESLSTNFYYASPNTIINSDKVEEYNYIDCQIVFDNGMKINDIIKKYNIC